jgi:hypothetical protein
VRPQKEKKKK